MERDQDLPGFQRSVEPSAGIQPSRGERRHPVAAGVVLTLGGVLLVALVAFVAWGVWGFRDSVVISASVLAVEDGWCTYGWEGEPRPSYSGANEDICPDGTQVEDQVQIVVFPDGTAWSSYASMEDAIGVSAVIGLTVVAPLLGLGLWLRRRVVSAPELAQGTWTAAGQPGETGGGLSG